MMRVFDGGEGDGTGGMVERSIERFDRDDRAEDDRDIGDGMRFMLLLSVSIAELPVLIVGNCSIVRVVLIDRRRNISLRTRTFYLFDGQVFNTKCVWLSSKQLRRVCESS